MPSRLTAREPPSSSISPTAIDAERRALRGGPAQDGADARDEFGGIEGLGQVIVGAHFEAADAVARVAFGRQHQDRNAGLLADAAEDVEAVGIGHHHVQHDQGVVFGKGALDAAGAAGGPADLEAFAGEVAGDEVAEFGIVIDNQHAFHDSRPEPFILGRAASGCAVKMCQAA